jgi:RNA polymerase sigma-70 factor (ECF subfamily)
MQPLAFADFYLSTRDDCLRAVFAAVGDRYVAEDLVAEAFARAWARWPQVCRHPSPKAWVMRTALNLRRSWWRRLRREIALDGHDIRTGEDMVPGMDGVLQAALLRLPRRQREIVALRIFLDLDSADTARVLGIAPSTVTVHLHRAISALRTQLTPPLT